jgi:glycosyltransferase involved in cell wall biosynthesis
MASKPVEELKESARANDAVPAPAERAVVPGRSPFVEIVIPVYNEERALRGCIRALRAFLTEEFPFDWVITIVDNASTDETLFVASSLTAGSDQVRVLHLDQKGRGRALRAAWQRSTADVVAYMDVDLSTGLDALLPLVTPLLNGHSDIAIGSRLAPGARTIRCLKRDMISRCYNALVRITHGARFSDAQCGFKAGRTDVVRALLDRVEDAGWFFDTELLLLAEHNGLRVHEVPVDWVEDVDSSVHLAATALEDLRGLLRVARSKARGEATVDGLPRRPQCVANPDGVSVRAGGLRWQVGSFLVVGVLSTLANLVLFAVFREWLVPLLANLFALVLCTLFNTEANRRITFGASKGPFARTHLFGLLVFALYYGFTSGALLVLYAADPVPGRALELVVLFAASVFGTVGRFLLLGRWFLRSG